MWDGEVRRWEGRGRDREVFEAMGRVREGLGGVWSDGKGACGMGWCMGRWEGRMWDREVYEAMGRAR